MISLYDTYDITYDTYLWHSLAKMPLHYCRKRTKRLYLEVPFNSLNQVFEIYKQHCAENKTYYFLFSKCYFSNYMKENNF